MEKQNHFNASSKTWDSPEKIAQAEFLAGEIRKDLKAAPQKLLEIGCGTGLLGGHFIGPETEYVGVDSSSGMLEKLREKFPGPLVKTHLLDLDQELPPERGFDLVVSSMAFHHLASPADLLARLSPHLAKGGRIAIVDLDKEDGSFHKDPSAMGVKHFGFSAGEIRAWEGKSLVLESCRIVDRIEKNGKMFGRFLAVFRRYE